MTEEELEQFHQLAMSYRGIPPNYPEIVQANWEVLVDFVNAMLAKREN